MCEVRKLDNLSRLKSGAGLNLIDRMFKRTSMAKQNAEWCEMRFIRQFVTSTSPFHEIYTANSLLPLDQQRLRTQVSQDRLTAKANKRYTRTPQYFHFCFECDQRDRMCLYLWLCLQHGFCFSSFASFLGRFCNIDFSTCCFVSILPSTWYALWFINIEICFATLFRLTIRWLVEARGRTIVLSDETR